MVSLENKPTLPEPIFLSSYIPRQKIFLCEAKSLNLTKPAFIIDLNSSHTKTY